MQLYTTEVLPNRAVLHWTYSERPAVGQLLGFFINLHYRNTRFPDQDGVFIVREFYDNISGGEMTEFSHLLIYLSTGVEYNVFVSAATIAGEGPKAKMSFKTVRTGMVTAEMHIHVL